ncbi:structural protein [Roseococcus thiosulfatophilus]|uniref:structural protein n=1 Tax=Roseococcus thiosulfatophilus TaxID=35813 RepID=UPI001A8FB400|nr:structural protein [Roseococcus thiosulfatophilus]
MSDPTQSRGYRNKNPGNIDHVPANRWVGLADPPLEPTPRDGGRRRFAVFTSHEYGIRALALLLQTYQDRHGLRTIRGIVNRWAPPNENSTGSYVRFVDEFLPGHGPDDRLDLHTYADARLMVEAIIRKELGGNPYDDATIDEGLRRAGVVRPVATIKDAAQTGTGRAALETGGWAMAATVAAPMVQSLAGLPEWTGVAVVAGFVLLAILIIIMRRRDA